MTKQLLEPEEGTTDVSLSNLSKLLNAKGRPTTLDFYANKRDVDYRIVATWADQSSFTFTGFSWGYVGTGPTGLRQMFDLLGVTITPEQVPMDKYGRTTATYKFV